ncbi:hypothetical protein ZWY2020_006558 [Hordeum vulgare]|nr:hypothetical protein ZWY2020_006558 [Hordeum vulgare]
MARGDSCLARIGAGVAIGGAVGGAVVSGLSYSSVLDKGYNKCCLWTYAAIRLRVPGLLKIRHIGQATVGSAAVFGLFLELEA